MTPPYPFVEARNFTRVTGNPRPVDLIVIHTMESPEKPSTAEDVAQWFAGPTAPQASCHYCIDANSVVRCVLEKDVAWAAPGINHNGIQFEHAGRAAQGPGGWADAYSQQMLRLSAQVAGEVCKRHSIPATYVSAQGLRAGKRGITTHANATIAFPGPGRTHTDPGPDFPMAFYVGLVRTALAPVTDDVTVEQAQAWWAPGKPISEMLPGPRPKRPWFWDAIKELDRRRRLEDGT